jgi:hypothetical protein
MDVSRKLLGINFGLDQDGFVSSLEEMAAPFMLCVEIDGIHCIQEVHHARQVAQRRFDDQVIMIGHQAINMHDHPEFLMSLPETLEKEMPVVVGEEYPLFLVAPGKHMIKGTRILNS